MKDCEQITWPSADELRPFMGQWVAIRDAAIWFSAGTPKEVIQKLRHCQDEDFTLLYVPTEEQHRHAR